jgi:hypothetical protein
MISIEFPISTKNNILLVPKWCPKVYQRGNTNLTTDINKVT